MDQQPQLPTTPQLTEDQISHETVNLMPSSIVCKEIIAHSTNPEAVRDKYWHRSEWQNHNSSVWPFQWSGQWCHTQVYCMYLNSQNGYQVSIWLKIFKPSFLCEEKWRNLLKDLWCDILMKRPFLHLHF